MVVIEECFGIYRCNIGLFNPLGLNVRFWHLNLKRLYLKSETR